MDVGYWLQNSQAGLVRGARKRKGSGYRVMQSKKILIGYGPLEYRNGACYFYLTYIYIWASLKYS